MRLRDVISLESHLGDRIDVGGVSLMPQSRALIVRWPRGGFVWNRPAAIMVERDGAIDRVPIADATRRAQWGLLGLCAGLFLYRRVRSSAKRRRQHG